MRTWFWTLPLTALGNTLCRSASAHDGARGQASFTDSRNQCPCVIILSASPHLLTAVSGGNKSKVCKSLWELSCHCTCKDTNSIHFQSYGAAIESIKAQKYWLAVVTSLPSCGTSIWLAYVCAGNAHRSSLGMLTKLPSLQIDTGGLQMRYSAACAFNYEGATIITGEVLCG